MNTTPDEDDYNPEGLYLGIPGDEHHIADMCTDFEDGQADLVEAGIKVVGLAALCLIGMALTFFTCWFILTAVTVTFFP